MRAPDWLTARPIAHRGLHDRARGIVENMPGAIDAAVAGNFAIEVDLQLTADGEAMVHHDDELGRLTEGTGALLGLTSAQLQRVAFRDTPERMMTLGDLCDRVAGRVPLVLEVKSRFDGNAAIVDRMAQVLSSYRGPVAAMSFDPDKVVALRRKMPDTTRGIVAQRRNDSKDWPGLTPDQRRGLTALRHGFQTQPHFVSYNIDDLPAPAPWIARNVFGCALLTWTVRTPQQRRAAERFADQITFEGFRPKD